ncbi:MBL fold metallo-hydrolase [Sphaerimonospora sp. CA-214678]|uniref:MBL fold metallo-hydrolase n=1 Tax=Sphaerimonospora sp. CA-214678 TaxID=3240029 RepID=UPI003D912396
MGTWNVGLFKVTEIEEFVIQLGLLNGLIPQATPEVIRELGWLQPQYVNDAGEIRANVHSIVVDTGDTKILVDAGCGNGKSYPMQPSWGGLDTPFLERLEKAGYGREDIDIILLTHLHLDHVGWCSMQDESGKWVPTFPNARLILVRDEYERHLSQIISSDALDSSATAAAQGEDESEEDRIARAFLPDAEALSNQTRLIQEETFQPVIDAGHLELVPPGTEIVPGVRYVSTPGHTSAHHSVRLESDGQAAFITGDFFHHPLQIARPEWSSAGDWDAEVLTKNRRAFLESAAGTDLLVFGTHFVEPSVGYIVKDGEGYRLTPTTPATQR